MSEFENTMGVTTFVVIGQHYWGQGFTEADAKASWKAQGHRRLTDGYTVIEFPPGIEFEGVDGMGTVHWRWPDEVAEADRVEIVVTEHAARKVNA